MNELSIFLYLANVVGNLGPMFAIFGVMGFAIAIMSGLVGMINLEYEPVIGAKTLNIAKKLGWISASLIVLACLTPSQKTVYLITASEVSEQVIESETGQKAVKALNDILDKLNDETS